MKTSGCAVLVSNLCNRIFTNDGNDKERRHIFCQHQARNHTATLNPLRFFYGTEKRRFQRFQGPRPLVDTCQVTVACQIVLTQTPGNQRLSKKRPCFVRSTPFYAGAVRRVNNNNLDLKVTSLQAHRRRSRGRWMDLRATR